MPDEEGECDECTARGSELLQRICKVLKPTGVDCVTISKRFESGELTLNEYAKEVFTLLAQAPSEQITAVTDVLEEYAPGLDLNLKAELTDASPGLPEPEYAPEDAEPAGDIGTTDLEPVHAATEEVAIIGSGIGPVAEDVEDEHVPADTPDIPPGPISEETKEEALESIAEEKGLDLDKDVPVPPPEAPEEPAPTPELSPPEDDSEPVQADKGDNPPPAPEPGPEPEGELIIPMKEQKKIIDKLIDKELKKTGLF
tara:strand:- start:80 stop:847 length:768 start_codon:yes stop_codon:yes gene_type:complete